MRDLHEIHQRTLEIIKHSDEYKSATRAEREDMECIESDFYHEARHIACEELYG